MSWPSLSLSRVYCNALWINRYCVLLQLRCGEWRRRRERGRGAVSAGGRLALHRAGAAGHAAAPRVLPLPLRLRLRNVAQVHVEEQLYRQREVRYTHHSNRNEPIRLWYTPLTYLLTLYHFKILSFAYKISDNFKGPCIFNTQILQLIFIYFTYHRRVVTLKTVYH